MSRGNFGDGRGRDGKKRSEARRMGDEKERKMGEGYYRGCVVGEQHAPSRQNRTSVP